MIYVFVPHAEIYLCLLNHNLTVRQIAHRLHRSQTTIRANLSALIDCGIVNKTGYPAVYSINPESDCEELNEISDLLLLARIGIYAHIGSPCFLDLEQQQGSNTESFDLDDDNRSQQIPSGCTKCVHLFGKTINGHFFVCAIHPYGLDPCPDF
jgi:hypothetical protein